MPIIELKNLKNIIFLLILFADLILLIVEKNINMLNKNFLTFSNKILSIIQKNGIRLNSITLGDVKHSNSIWNNKFNCKEDEDEYLSLTKLNSNYVRL